MTDNPDKQGRKRLWIRFERKYAGVTVHLDWYRNDRGDHVLAVENDASQFVFDIIETDRSSVAASVELLDSVQEQLDTPVPILEVITDQGSVLERYLHEYDIKDSLGKVGLSQSNGKIKRFYQTNEKHRWWLGTLVEFLTFYNEVRPHMSLD